MQGGLCLHLPLLHDQEGAAKLPQTCDGVVHLAFLALLLFLLLLLLLLCFCLTCCSSAISKVFYELFLYLWQKESVQKNGAVT